VCGWELAGLLTLTSRHKRSMRSMRSKHTGRGCVLRTPHKPCVTGSWQTCSPHACRRQRLRAALWLPAPPAQEKGSRKEKTMMAADATWTGVSVWDPLDHRLRHRDAKALSLPYFFLIIL